MRRYWEYLALFAIFALSAWLRFGWVGVSSYAGDEARISLDALRLTRGGEFVYIAQQSSTGIPFLPASVWMFAPPYLLSPDPMVATLYVCLISLFTVIGTWWLARRWGVWAGLAAALFMAASPYAVFYGRSIWQPNLLPAFGVLWAWSALRGVGRYQDKAKTQREASGSRAQAFVIALNCFLAGFVLQVHFAGAAFALGSLFLFVRYRWWRHPIPVLIGGGLALLCTVPYVYYLLTQAPQVLDQFRQVGGGGATIDLSAALNWLRLALGYDWGYLALGDYDIHSRTLVTAVLAGGLLLCGFITLVTNASLQRAKGASAFESDPQFPTSRTRNPQPRTQNYTPIPENPAFCTLHPALCTIVLTWLLVSPLFFLRHSTPVLPHYQLVALPAAALLVAAATRLLPQRAWRIGVTGAMLVLALLWTTQIVASLDRTAVERPPQSALSSIVNESRDAAAALPSDHAAVFFTHGDDPALSGEVAVFRTLLWEHPNARIVDGTTTLILPAEPATLMATLAPFQAWEELIASGLATDTRQYPRRLPAEPFVSVAYDGVSAPQGFTSIDRVALADGSMLEGWRVRRVGERLRISTLWHIDALPPETALQQFHHLYTTPLSDDLPPQSAPGYVSDVPLSAHQWRVGDRVIVIADFFDVPPGIYQLVIGHYTLADGTRIAVIEGGDSVVTGEFVWDSDGQ
ncbi:MAG: hypothetical protein SF123_14075 [Chloroflexota bacterium]|nr:hypothetical protein [Chloroflexota bacterium]